jgi:hypothetical protein
LERLYKISKVKAHPNAWREAFRMRRDISVADPKARVHRDGQRQVRGWPKQGQFIDVLDESDRA